MRFDILTLFPDMMNTYFNESVLGRAMQNGFISVHCHNIRDYTENKHKRVDDSPYGGGMGMVMQAEPVYNTYCHVVDELGCKPYVIYMSPKGSTLTQKKAAEIANMENVMVLCGHYEGVDQRIIDMIVDEEISIGDYVLTGGEAPAMVLVDTVSRMLPGVLPDSICFEDESHFSGLLEYPQYTKPAEFMGHAVPEVLLSGNHKLIKEWRYRESLQITKKLRPDLYSEYIEKNGTK